MNTQKSSVNSDDSSRLPSGAGHTPTAYFVRRSRQMPSGFFSVTIGGPNTHLNLCEVGGLSQQIADEKAAFIVRAVNSHDALVWALKIVDAALKGMMSYEHVVVSGDPASPDCITPAKIVRAVLEQAAK